MNDQEAKVSYPDTSGLSDEGARACVWDEEKQQFVRLPIGTNVQMLLEGVYK